MKLCAIILLGIAALPLGLVMAQEDSSLILSLFRNIAESQYMLNLENSDNNVQLLKEYDFIIVGAGTAGCTLAARLSENPKWNVLLLEAGGPEHFAMDIPILALFLQLIPQINWSYESEPSEEYCLGMKGNRCKFPRGKVMGGSSVLNYMLYTRGNRRDYDSWAEMGNKGWSYKDVLPYFKKFEGSTVPDAETEYVGRKGPVKIAYPNWRSVIAESFVGAVQEDGLPYRDYNGKRQIGVSYVQTTTNQKLRWSANRAYLYPLKGKRPNLHISKYSLVTKILIDPKTKSALGVRFEKDGQTFEVRARLEVISSAGSINTPQLLMLSGIGPAKHLKEVGITPLADLAVGFNLQDHFAPPLTFVVNETSLKVEHFFDSDALVGFNTNNSIISSPGGVEAISFYELDNPSDPDGWPDIEQMLVCGGLESNPALVPASGLRDDVYYPHYSDVLKGNLNGFVIWTMILKPRSRGRIMLRSQDPKEHPRIYPNYFRDPYDMDIIVRGLQKSIALAKHPSLQRLNATLVTRKLPACRKYGDVTSIPYLKCYARHFSFTIYHQMGTAKMGPKSDRAAVVDPRLRVYGINKLRVIDASVIPKIIAGHPNSAVYMIAEKAADMIKEDYGFV